jgi:hypothetical protein
VQSVCTRVLHVHVPTENLKLYGCTVETISDVERVTDGRSCESQRRDSSSRGALALVTICISVFACVRSGDVGIDQ